MTIPIFVIGNPQREPDQCTYLDTVFSNLGIQKSVTYFQSTYKDTLTESEIQTYFSKPNFANGRPIKRAEMSIWLNHIYLFQHILKSHKSGYFLIFESDVRFEKNPMEYFSALGTLIQEVQPELLSVGSGCDLIHTNVNTEDMNFQIFPECKVRCTDSFLWSYKGIQKFVDYIQWFVKEHTYLNQPIDNFLETFIGRNDKPEPFVQLWVWPSLTIQGREYKFYESTIQLDSD
jgi:GR25 family glycosyltransferase involved in LPS biosynthesis